MNDRELLELAAKAAGIKLKSWDVCIGKGINVTEYGSFGLAAAEAEWWNPLTDDGDALRLAVKLHIGIMARSDFTMTWQYCKNNTDVTVAHKDNPESATRRAIVRAAAEIGKAKS